MGRLTSALLGAISLLCSTMVLSVEFPHWVAEPSVVVLNATWGAMLGGAFTYLLVRLLTLGARRLGG